MSDVERVRKAETLARDGETGAAVDELWRLLREFADRAPGDEAPVSVRRHALEVLAVLAPDDVEVACARARLLLPDAATAALAVIQGALRRAPRNLEVLRVLAEVQRATGEEEKALHAYADLLDACREALPHRRPVLSRKDVDLVAQVRAYIRYSLWERADVRMRALLGVERFSPEIHQLAAEIARQLEKAPDLGLEHEIFAFVLHLARRDAEGARESLRLARDRYPESPFLRRLEGRFLPG